MAINLSSIPAHITTASAKIRYLASLGHSRADIAKALGKRYQHVRNVLLQEPKKPSAPERAVMTAADLGITDGSVMTAEDLGL